MKQLALHLYNDFTKTKTAITVAVVVLYLALAVYGGGKPLELLWFAVCILLWIVLPGLLLARLLKAETLVRGYGGPLALLLGAGFLAVLYCVSMRLGALWLLYALPPLMGLAWLALKYRALKAAPGGLRAARPPKPQSWQGILILLFAALLLLYTFASVIKNARPTAVGETLLNHDLMWNAGNAASFKLAFPPQDIRFTGVRLHYHYLTELVCGALSLVSGIPAYNILAFYIGPYTLGAMVLCLFRFARLLWPEKLYKALLFPYSLFLFSCASLWKILPNGISVFWNGHIMHLITNINSQSTAVIVLCIFCGLFITAARAKFRVGAIHTVLMLCCFVMLCFSKGPLAALVTVALVLALLVGLPLKKTGWRGLVLGAVLAALFGYIYLTMFSSGANNSMTLSATATLEGGYFANILSLIWHKNYYVYLVAVPALWFIQSFLMIPAAFPLYLRGVWNDVRRFTKLPVETLFFNAMAVGGLLAFFLFAHPHLSQTYFLYAAIFFIHLLAVDNLELLRWPQKGSGQKKVLLQKGFAAGTAFFIAVGLATTCFLYINILGSGARQLARNLGVIEKYPYDTVVTPDDELAMLWLKANTPEDAVFATNRIHTGARKEGISNLYSAFCERQGFMEGFQYAVTNMGVSEEVVTERIHINEALFNPDVTPEQVAALCHEQGIYYLVYCAQMDGSDAQLQGFEKVYDSESVRVYRVPSA